MKKLYKYLRVSIIKEKMKNFSKILSRYFHIGIMKEKMKNLLKILYEYFRVDIIKQKMKNLIKILYKYFRIVMVALIKRIVIICKDIVRVLGGPFWVTKKVKLWIRYAVFKVNQFLFQVNKFLEEEENFLKSFIENDSITFTDICTLVYNLAIFSWLIVVAIFLIQEIYYCFKLLIYIVSGILTVYDDYRLNKIYWKMVFG